MDNDMTIMNETSNKTLAENSNNKNAIVPRFSLTRIPVGYPKGTTVQVTDSISYHFNSMVRDNSVKLWIILLKVFTDEHYKEIQEFSKRTISLSTFTQQFVGNFDLAEVKKLMYGKSISSKKILDSIERIMDIDVNIYNEGKKVGVTSFVQTAVILEDKKTLRVAFNSVMLYTMAQNMKALNFNKMLEYQGSAFRLFLAMNHTKKPLGNGKYGYISKDHEELCKMINVDVDYRHTIRNIQNDFNKIGIKFKYYKYENKWDY